MFIRRKPYPKRNPSGQQTMKIQTSVETPELNPVFRIIKTIKNNMPKLTSTTPPRIQGGH